MFLSHYGLREQPFGVTPDPRFLYLSDVHREALASLIYGIESGLGFASLVAEPGTGKTTLLYYLLQYYRATARTAFVFDSQCTSRELVRNLLLEFELEAPPSDSLGLLNRFRDFLAAQARAGRRVLVVLDEAQNFDDAVLETVRLLSNFETPGSKLLHIILSGQPQLAEKLLKPQLLNVRQRISIATRLRPFTPVEVVQYIAHRLKIAGYNRDSLFTPDALQTVALFSHGNPREINRICFNALSLGCALGLAQIGADAVEEVVGDFDFAALLTSPSACESLATPSAAELAAVFTSAMALEASTPTEPAPEVNSELAEGPAVAAGSAPQQLPGATTELSDVNFSECGAATPDKRRWAKFAVAYVVVLVLVGIAFQVRSTIAEATPASNVVKAGSAATPAAPLPPIVKTTPPPLNHVAARVVHVAPLTIHRPQRIAKSEALPISPDPDLIWSAAADPGTASAPVLVKRVDPPSANPEEPGRMSGEVVMTALVGRDGQVASVHVDSGPTALQEIAVNAVRQWVFEPGRVDGEAKPMQVKVRLQVTQ